jgi:hypothetical protein
MRVTIRDLEDWVRPRTVTTLTLILLVALWSVVIASAVSGRQASIASTGELLQRTGRAVEEQTLQQLRLTDVLLATAAHWLQANPGRDPRSDPAFRKLLEGFRARTGDSIDIQLLTVDGSVFDVLGKSPRPLAKVADSEYFKGALASKALFIGRPESIQRSGGYGLPIALALPSPIHGIQMIVAIVDLPTLIGRYEGQRQQAGGAITLLRNDGVVLARAPEDAPLPGQSIAEGRLFGERLRQPPRTLLLLDETHAGEKKEFVSYSPVGDFPLLIAVSEDYDEALLPWLKQTLWIVLLALGVTRAAHHSRLSFLASAAGAGQSECRIAAAGDDRPADRQQQPPALRRDPGRRTGPGTAPENSPESPVAGGRLLQADQRWLRSCHRRSGIDRLRAGRDGLSAFKGLDRQARRR